MIKNNNYSYLEEIINTATYCFNNGCTISGTAYADRVYKILETKTMQEQEKIRKKYKTFFKIYHEK